MPVLKLPSRSRPDWAVLPRTHGRQSMTSHATNPWPSALTGAVLEPTATPSVAVPCGHAAHFGDPVAEYAALMQTWGVADFSLRTQIEVRGSDRASFIHNLCTAHVKRLQAGQGTEAF